MRAGAHTGGNADTHKASPSMPHSASVSARVTTCLASMSPFGELSCIKTDAPCESQTAAAGKGRKGHEVLGRGRQAAGARTSRRRRGAWARRRHTTRTWGWLLPVPARMTTAQKHAAAAMIINVAGSHCHNQATGRGPAQAQPDSPCATRCRAYGTAGAGAATTSDQRLAAPCVSQRAGAGEPGRTPPSSSEHDGGRSSSTLAPPGARALRQAPHALYQPPTSHPVAPPHPHTPAPPYRETSMSRHHDRRKGNPFLFFSVREFKGPPLAEIW